METHETLRHGLLVMTRNGVVETLDGRPIVCPVDGERITAFFYREANNGHRNLYLTHHNEDYVCGCPSQIRQAIVLADDDEVVPNVVTKIGPVQR